MIFQRLKFDQFLIYSVNSTFLQTNAQRQVFIGIHVVFHFTATLQQIVSSNIFVVIVGIVADGIVTVELKKKHIDRSISRFTGIVLIVIENIASTR